MRSPPPAPSSGAGVRRKHTIHGPRHHGKPRLEKHFEQPEDSASGPTRTDGAAPSPSAPRSTRFNEDQPLHGLHASPSSKKDVSLANSSSFSIISGNAAEFVPSLTPLQALYSKSSVSRNLSLPTVTRPAHHQRAQQLYARPHQPIQQPLGYHWRCGCRRARLGKAHPFEQRSRRRASAGSQCATQSFAADRSALVLFALLDRSARCASSVVASDLAHHRNWPLFRGLPSRRKRQRRRPLGDTQALGGSASFLRRHQSLNQPAARSAAQRLAARSSDLRSRYVGDSVDRASSSHSSQTDAAFSPPQHTTSFSATNSPVMHRAIPKHLGTSQHRTRSGPLPVSPVLSRRRTSMRLSTDCPLAWMALRLPLPK